MLSNTCHIGNPWDPVGDHHYVDCTQCKESFSARLDNEEGVAERAELDTHFMICVACRWFADRAVRVTRLARTAGASEDPNLVEAILATAQQASRPQLRSIPYMPFDSDVRCALEAARFCGCTCCRRWTGLLTS